MGARQRISIMALNTTLLDLVTAVAKDARTENEIIATVVAMVNGGSVRLCGSFKASRFDLEALSA
jgi:hypothetical protein